MAVTAVPLQDELVGDVRLTLYLVWGVVGVVLLIACANTATLLLGKATARTREMAVRTALGAGRGRILRQLITESLLLALVAGVCGMLLASWGVRALVALSPADVIRLTAIRIDWGVLAFTLGISLATSVFFGLVPALHASKVDLIDVVKQAGARSVVGGRTARTRGMLVVAEIALAVVLLTGAGLLVKSLMALHQAELGFQPANVLVVKATGVRSRPENDVFFGQLMARLAALPGVRGRRRDVDSAGRLFQRRHRTPLHRSHPGAAQPRSRAPHGDDDRGARLVCGARHSVRRAAAISMTAMLATGLSWRSSTRRWSARRCRARIRLAGPSTVLFDRSDPMTIVGVVGDVRQRNPAVPPLPECYMPYRQHSYNNATLNLVVRTVGDPTALAATVRRVAVEISPEVPLSFTTMEAQVSKGLEDPRFRTLLFGDLRRIRGVPRDGGRVRRDGLRRPAAIERDRPADGARRQPGHRC